MSVVIKERERERDRNWDDNRTTVSRRSGAGSFTTVRRYRVPDRDSDRHYEDDRVEETTRIIREDRQSDSPRDINIRYVEREVERAPSPPRSEYRVTTKVERAPSPPRSEYRVVDRVVREVEREAPPRSPRSDYRVTYEHEHVDAQPARSEYRITREHERAPSPQMEREREIRIIREGSRSPSPPRYREFRMEREFDEPRHEPYALEKYSKSTEFFSQPQAQPQPIIIRQEAPQPIIIREEAPQREIIIRREEPREPSYEFVERTETRDDRSVVSKRPPPQQQEEDYYFERRTREIKGRGEERERRREREDDHYSEDDDVYIRRERTEGWERDSSPHHKRHLAEGVLAGVGAAEIIRHHRKKQGEPEGSHIGQLAGYGALGAVGAEAITRLRRDRDRSDSRSRSRERDSRRGREDRRRHRSKSRPRSGSRNKHLLGLAAVAGIGALAYAAGKSGKNQQTTVIEERPHRSRSRRRRSSVAAPEIIAAETKHIEPDHRNRKIAQAGLASAAVAGLVERARSKSRGGRNRSQSRVRQGLPIIATGLAGAAVAGLYENRQKKKEEKVAAVKVAARERSLSRGSRSRSRSRSVVARDVDETDLVQYGGDPIHTDPAAENFRRRSRSRDYYEDPADYRHRRRGSSASSDSRGRRHRSRSGKRSRSRSNHRLAETAAVAGVAGIAAHEAAKRRERKKAEKERRQHEQDAANAAPPPEGYSPPGTGPYQHDNYSHSNGRFYPETNEFPPPPGPGEAYPPNPNNYQDPNYANFQHPQYNPADYAQQPRGMEHEQGYPPSPYQQQEGNPYYNDPNRPRGHGDNVSAPPPDEHSEGDGLETPRASTPQKRSKSVHFDPSPDRHRKHDDRSSTHTDIKEEETSRGRKHRRRSFDHTDGHHRSHSEDSVASDSTEELPPRFDERGNSQDAHEMGFNLEDILSGRGQAGRLFQSIAGDILSPSGSSSGRRR